MSSIWTEKYRPSSFDDVKGQEHIVSRIKSFVDMQNMPHLLFSGPSGVGKSSLAIVIAKKLFGEEWKQDFLELNSSDERGIDVIRNTVKNFARTRAIGNVPFKVIFLDECDALTKDAQHALRRTMENYTQTCRFILSCVTPDTKILLPGERETMAKEFFDQYELGKEIKVQNISAKRDSSKEDLVLAAVRLPASSIGKKVLEISTMTGRKLKLTEDHKLLTVNGWKEAGNISKEDKLLIYPNLEGTPVEDNKTKIVDLVEFVNFLSWTESRDGLNNIKYASSFKNLKSSEKNKILERIEELRKTIQENKGLTKREFEVYQIIKQNPNISRKNLQDKCNLTRIGINYLLPSLENKEHIIRSINKKIHSFTITNLDPIILRNDMDIRKIIENEFDINISYTTVKKSRDKEIKRGRVDRVIGELKRKELIDITYNDIDKVGALARISGFMLGDGHLVKNDIRLHFSGNKEALKEVQKDLDILEFNNYSRIISVKLENTLRGRKFSGVSTSFTLDSISFSLLLQYLGVKKGDKTITRYKVPEFVKKGTKFVKREFLRALFGCDADKPNYKNKNFGAVNLRQNKAKILKENILNFYKELSIMFNDFGIESYISVRDKKEFRKKDNEEVLTFELTIKPNNENLFRFFSRVGYTYENYKINLARLSAEYLRHKLQLIKIWNEKSKIGIELVNQGQGIRETAREIGTSPDFVSNQIKGKKVHLPRNKFLDFDIWISHYKFNELLITNEISDIKEINEDLVMDITCHNDHNFITNGIVSHNCNYASKIIDPIQSRCTLFKFRPLSKEDTFKILSKIENEEGLKIDEDAKEALYEASGGDCRKVENILQSCAVISNEINSDNVYQIASAADPKELKEALQKAVKGNFLESRKELLKIMLNYGLSGLDIIRQIQKLVWELDVDDNKKMKLIEDCGEIEFRMVEGSDEFIQLEALLARFGS